MAHGKAKNVKKPAKSGGKTKSFETVKPGNWSRQERKKLMGTTK